MNIALRNPLKTLILLGSMLTGAALVNGCGGGAALAVSGIGGTGIVFGSITGFGSIYVNGKRYSTDESEFIVDGDTRKGQDDLAIGMVVKLRVEIENGGLTDRAVEVEYDDDVQGPVSANPQVVAGSGGKRKQFDIFGQTVFIDETVTVFAGTGFDDLARGDLVEISGFRGASDEINASYVERKGDLEPGVSEVELRGRIRQHDPAAGEFKLGGTLIRYNGNTEIDTPNGEIEDGLFVEVEGRYNDMPSVFVQAEEIEVEEKGFGDEIDEISLQGVISDYRGIDDFVINGQAVDASDAEISPEGALLLLGNGLNIEVEGNIVDGVLIAAELELREGESEIGSTIDSINLAAGSFQLGFAGLPGTITILTTAQTTFKDDAGDNPLRNMRLLDLHNDYVELEGIASGDTLIANVVKRKEARNEVELKGPVGDFDDAGFTWVEILGLVYKVNPLDTEFSDGDTAAEFFAQLRRGDIVKIADEPADGVADEIEIEE